MICCTTFRWSLGHPSLRPLHFSATWYQFLLTTDTLKIQFESLDLTMAGTCFLLTYFFSSSISGEGGSMTSCSELKKSLSLISFCLFCGTAPGKVLDLASGFLCLRDEAFSFSFLVKLALSGSGNSPVGPFSQRQCSAHSCWPLNREVTRF